MKNSQTRHRNILLWLSGIFLLRIFLQWLLQKHPVDFLPSFDLWHTNTISYPLLLTIQLALLAVMVTGALLLTQSKAQPKLGSFLRLIGWLYLAGMVTRLMIGALAISDHDWFNGVVSTAFHFALAAYLVVLGNVIKGGADTASSTTSITGINKVILWLKRCAPYPCIVVIGYTLFFRLTDTGSPLMFSAYLCVLLGATAILIHETLSPHREDWQPTANEMANDGLFLIFVQIALPAIFKALALAAVVWLAENNLLSLSPLWPHSMSILMQVMLMLVVAEFFRYWIHRASHYYKPLWKLHAVHHASNKLYIVNVGRFHPLDKSLQFLGDSLPFLLLGISADVFAAYFVFYAINGFYQHSNADIKLGWLNTLIAGPELHRWHHSANLKQAKSNFGNNLIIWDSVFGTRYLPHDEKLTHVGIGNKHWPESFVSNLLAPFTTSTEATLNCETNPENSHTNSRQTP